MKKVKDQIFGYLISTSINTVLQVLLLRGFGYMPTLHWQVIALLFVGTLATWIFIIYIANNYNNQNRSKPNH